MKGQAMTIKKYWIAAITASILSAGAVAQTSASGSASGNASVNPGQAGAGASTSQSAQTSGASANVNANANAQASQEKDSKNKDKDSNSGASAGSNATGAASAGAGDLSAGLAGGTALQAELTKSVDAKKAKSGDEVTAKLTQDVKSNGKVVLHKGSKLVGHVTEAQAKSKENAESKLGIVFDKAIVKGGQEVSFNSVIQAVAPPLQATSALAGDESGSLGGGMGSGGMGRTSPGGGPLGGAVGGVTNTAGSAAGGVSNTAGNVAGSTTGAVGGSVNNTVGAAANGTLNSASRGVIGLQGVALNTAAAGSAQGSVISSTSRNIKLDAGTQMVLQVTGAAAAK
jgi:hypothetical protein